MHNKIICETDKCSGCGCCINICPKNCISMVENEIAETHPMINSENCIDCGLCEKVCPQIHMKLNDIKGCFAAYADEKVFCDSASGGIALYLYKKFLEMDPENSFIVGVSYDDEMHAIFKLFSSKDDILPLSGSKYVQAKTGNIFRECSNLLMNNKKVLFVGLPCHISGLINYIELKHIRKDNLFIIDLLCHGVAPQRFLDEEIQYLSNRYKWDGVSSISFRSNRKFRNFHFYVEAQKNGKIVRYNRYFQEDPYFYGFLQGIILRESCYHCSYANSRRAGDLTLGDFIGLGHNCKYDKYKGKKKDNVSMILLNTNKGKDLLKLIDKDVYIERRHLNEAIEGGASLREPFQKSLAREKFLAIYKKTGFFKAIEDSLNGELKKNRIRYGIKRIVAQMIIKLRSIEVQ